MVTTLCLLGTKRVLNSLAARGDKPRETERERDRETERDRERDREREGQREKERTVGGEFPNLAHTNPAVAIATAPRECQLNFNFRQPTSQPGNP